MRGRLFVILLLFFFRVSNAQELKIPAIFSDNMVLQQKSNVPVWGWDAPGKVIQVTGSWNNKTVKAVTDNTGKWMLKLSTSSAGGPYTLTINGEKSIAFQNVMIGEVWICSGQSNMEMPMSGWGIQTVQNSENVIKQASEYPNIRLFNEERKIATTPQSDCSGHWVNSSPESVATFSAVGYFFGLELYKRLNIPVGLIMTTWGGTPSEAWTSAEEISKYSDFKSQIAYLTNHDQHIIDSIKFIKDLADWKYKIDVDITKMPVYPFNKSAIYASYPSVLFNGMINPLIPFAVKGAIWYQGESNVNDAKLYGQIFPAMVKCWRSLWNQGDFPFYYVQIAPFDYGSDAHSELLREAQLKSLKTIPNSGMAVTMDIATIKGIHPPNKEAVGKRLANWALAKDYGIKDVAVSGPIYTRMMIEDQKIRLYFDYAKKGLEAIGGELTNFEIAGNDHKFFPAMAVIENNTVVVSNFAVPEPIAVRYGWSNTATPNLFNTEGLPASPFRTDNWDK
jgi:sialate O-acetylesterase